MAEYVGRPRAAADAVGARGIDHWSNAFGVVMVEEKKEGSAYSWTKMGAHFLAR